MCSLFFDEMMSGQPLVCVDCSEPIALSAVTTHGRQIFGTVTRQVFREQLSVESSQKFALPFLRSRPLPGIHLSCTRPCKAPVAKNRVEVAKVRSRHAGLLERIRALVVSALNAKSVLGRCSRDELPESAGGGW